MTRFLLFAAMLVAATLTAEADSEPPPGRLLVTFANSGVKSANAGFSAPYRYRKRYAIAASARQDAADIAREYALTPVDDWPIDALSVYCIVYRLDSGDDVDDLLVRLRADERVESAQRMHEFTTSGGATAQFNDTYARLQHGLGVLGIGEAHRISRGEEIRIAIVDSDVDARHEDLSGTFVENT